MTNTVIGEYSGRSSRPVAGAATRPAFLPYINLFRGLAILQVVFVHAAESYLQIAANLGERNLPFAAIETLFHDGTTYFALISGVLYVHVFARRGVASFYRARLAFVLTPYVILSVLLTAAMWIAMQPQALHRGPEFLGQVLHNLRTGEAWFQLWYIPIAIGLFAVSPLIEALSRSRRGVWVVMALVLAPLVISRTGNYPGLPTFLYFLGSYAAGILVGANIEAVIDRARAWMVPLCVIAAAATIALILLFMTGIDTKGVTSIRETLFYVQKMALAGVLAAALRAWAQRPGRVRDLVLNGAAAPAFAIYFLHGPLMILPLNVMVALTPRGANGAELAAGTIAVYLGVLAVTAIVIWLVKRVLGARSRYLIGA